MNKKTGGIIAVVAVFVFAIAFGVGSFLAGGIGDIFSSESDNKATETETIIIEDDNIALEITDSEELLTDDDDNQVSSYGNIVIAAHRGYSGVAPENTLAAFKVAMDVNADMIELDVQMTKDGEIVVFHDSDMGRITGKSGTITGSNAADVKARNAGKWFPVSGSGMTAAEVEANFASENIPTLSEVLECIKEDDIILQIELKDLTNTSLAKDKQATYPEKVANIVSEAGMQDRIVFSSFNHDYLAAIKELDQSNKTMLITILADADELVTNYDADAYSLDIDTLSQETIEMLHEYNKEVYVWTADNEAQIRNAIYLGADGIVTNQPGAAKVLANADYQYLSDNFISTMPIPEINNLANAARYANFEMDGFSLAREWVVVAGHGKDGSANNTLFVMDGTGIVWGIIDMGYASQDSQIAYDEAHNLMWITGNDGDIYAVDWTGALTGNRNKFCQIATGIVPEFITIDSGYIYAGDSQGTMKAYNLEQIVGQYMGTEQGAPIVFDGAADIEYAIPLNVSGMTIAHNQLNKTKTMIMAIGSATGNSKMVRVLMKDGNTDYTSYSESYTMPAGLAQIKMTGSGLYQMYTGGAKINRTEDSLRNDRIWLVDFKP